MTENNYTFIRQEITALGIKPEYFETFYTQLREQKRLPPIDVIPTEQYQSIVNYLTERQVLGAKGVVKEDGLKLFDSRKSLEERLQELAKKKEKPRFRHLGGIAPCRREEDENTNRGGILPCRD